MRRAGIAFLVTFAAGLALVAALGVTRGSDLVYSPGAVPAGPVATIGPDQRACQGPVRLPQGAAFDRVAMTLGTYFRPGPAVRVEVLDAATGRRLAAGDLPGGYPDIAGAPEHVVRVDRVRTADPLRICIVDRGDRKVAIYGQPTIAAPRSDGSIDGKPIPFDLALQLRSEKRSLIALLPTMAERAALFRAGWVTPLAYLVLALALLVGAPVALARGIARAAAADER